MNFVLLSIKILSRRRELARCTSRCAMGRRQHQNRRRRAHLTRPKSSTGPVELRNPKERQCEKSNLMTEPAVRDHGGAAGTSGPRGSPTTADAPYEHSRAAAQHLQLVGPQPLQADQQQQGQLGAEDSCASRLLPRSRRRTGTRAARACATSAGRKSRPRARSNSCLHWQGKKLALRDRLWSRGS